MPSSGFSRLSNLPGQARNRPTQSTTDSVGSFQNQQIGKLATGTGGTVGAQGSPSQQLLGMRRPETGVQMSAKRTTDAVRTTNQKLMSSAQTQGRKRQEAEMQRQAQSSQRGQQQGGKRHPQQAGGHFPGDGHDHGPMGPETGAGPAVGRVQNILKRFPGLRITETLGNRDYDQRNGVARSRNSYHYDNGNPAVDIAGSPAQLHKLYKQLVAEGGWRQILWQVPGHYDHIHVAAEGGQAGGGEFGTAVATRPEEVPASDTELTALTPGEFVVTDEAADRIGPDKLDALNSGAELEDVVDAPMSEEPMQQEQVTGYQAPGAPVSELVSMAYNKLGPQYAQHIPKGATVPGVRTALRNLRPGDIVAWKDGSHIAVYAGNGEVMDAKTGRRKLWAPESSVFGIALRLPGE